MGHGRPTSRRQVPLLFSPRKTMWFTERNQAMSPVVVSTPDNTQSEKGGRDMVILRLTLFVRLPWPLSHLKNSLDVFYGVLCSVGGIAEEGSTLGGLSVE